MKKNESTVYNVRDTLSPRRARALISALVAMILVIFACSCAMLWHSYRDLQDAIQMERMDYVEEISGQIITSQRFMEREYSDTVANYAGVVERADITSIEDVRECLSRENARDILMVTQDGEIYDLNGSAVFLSDRQLMENLPEGDEVVRLFNSLSYTNDYWLFAAALDPIVCGDDTYITIVLAVSADEFRGNLAISLFDGRGASYIIKKDGSIGIKPTDANLAFDGYNLFAGMLQRGASDADISTLREDMRSSAEGSFLFKISGQDWLISHSAIDAESSIVVAVPLAVTAVRTYSGLSSTIIFTVAGALSMAAVVILFVLYFAYRDRQRSREVMAAAAKSDFFSKMSHDIRTPLNAVIGLELLARDCSDNPQVQEYLRQSSAAADYLLSIINDVLDMRRIESGKLDISSLPFDMNELTSEVRDLAATMALEKGLSFEAEVDLPFETEYIGDQVRVKQIMMNLLSNATKFTKEGGLVKLEVSHRPDADGYDSVTVVVSDNGVGMTKEFLAHAFAPFEQENSSYTQQFAGSGLGLAIVHSLVTMMNGTINVDSEVGVGSAITIVLPFERGGKLVHKQREEEPERPAIFTGRRVLVAEDNPVNQQVAAAILSKKFDLSVEIASDGQEAVDMFASSEEGCFDLLLMDVKMPVMDGLEATRRIRALPRGDAGAIPIVALSANAFEEDVALSLAAGMDAHLSKPINVEALGKVLETFINKT